MAITFHPKDYFKTLTYTGNNASSHAITGVGFQPGWTWIKSRNHGESHRLYDIARGVANQVAANSSGAETNAIPLTSFDSDGFTIGTSDASVNGSYNYVSWNWKGGTTSGIATNGSTTITPSSYSFDQARGVSILKYNGNGVDGAKIAHGLGAAPEVIWLKTITGGSEFWQCYWKSRGNQGRGYLNSNNNWSSGQSEWGNTTPDSVNITLSNDSHINASGYTYVIYAFRSINGFSACGRSYYGNGNANGTFIYTGFKPGFLITKQTGSSSEDWTIKDLNRLPSFNRNDRQLFTNSANQENTSSDSGIDLYSNGFKIRSSNGKVNTNGADYVWIAFAQEGIVAPNKDVGTAI
tara:strand:+ start:2150 stop:3202 length:1053 start_codon:yes stop_codon:yes gene_type:complete